MEIANDKEIYPMMSSKVNEDKGEHWCYWQGPLPLSHKNGCNDSILGKTSTGGAISCVPGANMYQTVQLTPKLTRRDAATDSFPSIAGGYYPLTPLLSENSPSYR
ncbi:hypothetical protein L2E82_53737 [Cichorium intybus]|nr:hypothetical protein L2E82_53737 [Cichorium intybus]